MYMINLNQFFPRLNNQMTNKFVPKIEGDGWIYGDLHISSSTQPEVEKFVDTKIRLQQILYNLSIAHPSILVDSDIENYRFLNL